MPNTIVIEKDGTIAIVRLNRPQVLNALNEELLTELGAAMRDLDDDAAIRCIVLTGNDKAFAAGADTASSLAPAARSASRAPSASGSRTR